MRPYVGHWHLSRGDKELCIPPGFYPPELFDRSWTGRVSLATYSHDTVEGWCRHGVGVGCCGSTLVGYTARGLSKVYAPCDGTGVVTPYVRATP